MLTLAGNRCALALRISCLAVSALLFANAACDYAYAEEATAALGTAKTPKPPGNQARAASLADVASGRVLFSQRGDEPMKIASLTKIMTAIVAIENGDMDSTLQVSAKAAGKEGSSIYLKSGEKMTLRNALYGLMLRSGNDAATAIAEHVGGSVEGFVYLMNKKADEIGLAHSHFMNPHGLDEQGHYSSANDLAKLTVYALHNPDFKEIVKTRIKKVPNPNDPWEYEWVNKNKMLTMYEGADGVKTGYTKQALRTLVSSATRDGQQLVAVTLNDRDDWADHRNLLDFGFARFPLASVTKAGEPIAGYPYEVTKEFIYPFAEGERERLVVSMAPLREGTADYKLGYRGQLRFVLDGKQIGAVPFVDDPSRGLSQQEQSSSREKHMAGIAEPSPVTTHPTFAASFRSVLKALFMEGGAS
ncbi:D-alanyl-D-alanine carboxypeptidase [Cohnella endophytica]|uniref:D-alanyl-D-alanine carboxypeptidase n=1 Tax=Cohnella endophytica TaxID=2419778 RepID=A0A494YB04_9BACL|nr:D-alanyl-D-alanine carboxypeptidase family protein [Cohnella endophytica]RKP57102.1 D-alanyl-D-alanine carboxypeptidase [Cohnella endophytica]